MKILIVSQYFWPESFRINDVAAGLVERGHEVTVLTGMPNYPQGWFYDGYGPVKPREEDYGGVRVLRVPLLPRRSSGNVWLSLNYLSFAVSASLLGPFVCRGEYNLILVYEPSPVTVGIPAVVLKWVKGLPIMFWVQDLWPESLSAAEAVHDQRILNAVALLVRFIYKHCDRVLVQSRAFAPRVESLGVEPEDVLYFPNWAEELYRPVDPDTLSAERAEMPPGFTMMYAGNVGAAQSFETILEAAGRLRDRPDISWVIMGEGRMRDWVARRVKQMGLEKSVLLLGSRPIEAMPRYFALADVLLVSLRKAPIFSLTIPSKIQSYLASGRPILASLDGEGARVIRESGAGLVSPAQDAQGLAESVLEMYNRPSDERREMGRSGRAYFEEHFRREKLLDRLEGWMRDLLKEKG